MKFAPCPCDESEEAWELQGRLTYIEDATDEGVTVVEYECQTCGERVESETEAKRV